MNNKKLNIDEYTKKLVRKGDINQPGPDFTKSVMGQILKDPKVQVSLFTADDKKSNWWLFISVGVMFIAYLIYYFIKNGFNINSGNGLLESFGFVKAFSDFFINLFSELSISPFILLALIGVVVLVILDKTIVRYLYSI